MPVVDFNVGKWVKAILTADQGVKALVAARIYPVTINLATDYPAITYRRVGVDTPGTVKGLAGILRPIVRINGWDKEYDSACAVVSAVLEALKDGGSIARQPQASGLKVGTVLAQGAGDEFFAPNDASKDFLYGPFVDFLISYQ